MGNLSVPSLFLLLVFLTPSNSSAAPPVPPAFLDGHWTGAMTRDGKSSAVNLDIESTAKNPIVLGDLVDYGIYALPFSIIPASNKLRLKPKQPSLPSFGSLH